MERAIKIGRLKLIEGNQFRLHRCAVSNGPNSYVPRRLLDRDWSVALDVVAPYDAALLHQV
jgi:hypothetical protein